MGLTHKEFRKPSFLECKHVAAVEMYREAQDHLEQATSMATTVGLHDALERSLEDQLADLY